MTDTLHAHDEEPPRDEVSVSMWLLPVLLAGIVLFAVATVAHAGLYKWTDDQGVVHYSDRLPADAVNRARVELNRDGIPIRKTAKAVPKAQGEESQADLQRERDLARARTASERRDRALLDSYSSVAEIDLAKGRALSAINAQIASATNYIADMNKRRDGLLAEKAGYGTHAVPNTLTHELAALNADLARQQAFITRRKSEAATISARYDADRLRYDELTRAPTSSAVSSSAGTRISDATRTPTARD